MSDFVSRLVDAVSKGFSRKKSIKRNKHRGRSYARLRLEALEDRVVPSYVWNPSNMAANADFSNPTNWRDTSTGTFAVTAPDRNTDCIFSATSPTTCNIVESSVCATITTDPNWNGRIIIGSNVGAGLLITGIRYTNSGTTDHNGTSTIEGGAIVANDNTSGPLMVEGGTFDYNGSNLNQTREFSGNLTVFINGSSAKFIVDKNCLGINANFEVGADPNGGTDSAGTLVFNTITPESKYSGGVNTVNVHPFGTVVYNPGAHFDSNDSIHSYGTVVINDNVSLIAASGITTDKGGLLETVGSGSAYINSINMSSGKLQMSTDRGGYFHLSAETLDILVGSTFVYHVDGEHLSGGNTIDTSNLVYLGDSTSVCYTDGTTLLPGDHTYTPITSNSSINGQFSNLVWQGDTPEVWTVTYPGSSFSLSGTVAPPPPAFHSYLWSPGPNTDSLWNTASNWFDQTTGATATSAPNDHTDVYFSAASAWEYCHVDPRSAGAGQVSAECRSIHIAPGPNHLLDLSSGFLEVFGVNGADSDIEGGEIDSAIGGGYLQVNGGNFIYNAPTLNHPLVFPTAVWVLISGGGNFTVGPACLTMYNTGYGVAPFAGDSGTLTMNTTSGQQCNFVNSSINVGSSGTLTFAPFASVNNAAITSFGNVILNNGDLLFNSGSSSSSPSGMLIEGGTLQDKGVGYIQGNLLIYYAHLEILDDPINTLSMLMVNGNLTMINSSFDFNLYDNGSYMSDRVVAGTITLFGNCTSNCTTVATSFTPNSSIYLPMSTFNSQFYGTFSTYNWLGTGKVWTPKYINGQYQLVG